MGSDSTPIDGEEKLRRYDLGMEIHKGRKEELTPEEIVLLKELVGKFMPTLVSGQVFKMLAK